MEDQVMGALLGLMARHGYQKDQFAEFLKKEVRDTGSIITAEFKNNIAKFEVVKIGEVNVTGEIDRVSWDYNRALEIEFMLQAKADFDKFHPEIDSKWVYGACGSLVAYYPKGRPRKVKNRKFAAHRKGGVQVNDTHFRKTNNSRRGY